MYLHVRNIHKSFTDKPVLDGVEFSILPGQKVALVAKNGAGKSTLLHILTGKIDAEAGEVIFAKGIRVGFLSQETTIDKDMIVLDVLLNHETIFGELIGRYERLLLSMQHSSDTQSTQQDAVALQDILAEIEEKHAWEYEVKVKTIISKLQLTPFLQQTYGSLSGWEAKRVALAKVLLDEPDFLLLDEPTNHLDIEMIEWLERFLKDSALTLLMVTHDRYFLERVCTHILELDRGKVYSYTGGYDAFLEQKALRLEQEQRTMHNLKQYLKHELERVRKAPRARGTKSVERTQRFHDLHDAYSKTKTIRQQEAMTLDLRIDPQRLWWKILKIHNLQKSFGNKVLLKDFSYEFRKGERVGIIGKNGVGKSTFVQMLIGTEAADSGSIRAGETIQMAYYQQREMQIDPEKRVIDVVRDIAEYVTFGKSKLSASDLLEHFLFPAAQQHMRAEKLSGGEKRRLHLLTVLIKNPNFLILDEPTNDLDLITITILEDFLLQYTGCLIVISHDRFFMDRIVDHLFVFEGEWVVKDFWWTYTEYKEYTSVAYQTAKQQAIEEDEQQKKLLAERTTFPPKQKLSYNEKKEFELLEQDISDLEARKEQINILFQNTELDHDQIKVLGKELGTICEQLETKEARRLELAERG